MTNTDFGIVADDLRRAASSFALLTSAATTFGASINQFREFEKQLTLVNAIAGGTKRNFDDASEAVRRFSLETSIQSIQAIDALRQLAQAGFSAEESLTSMAGVLLLAQATFSDISLVSDLVTSSIRAFGLSAEDTVRISNLFTASVTNSLATIDKLAFALRQVAPVANLANLSIEETVALLSELFNVGLRGEQAGTALRNIIIRLVRPLGEANNILRRYGIATQQVTGELRPLVDILNDLRTRGVSNAELAQIFETEALAGVVTLLESTKEGADGAASAYENQLKAISNTDKALEIAVQNLQTFDGSLQLLLNTLRDIGRRIGEALAPSLQAAADLFRELYEEFNLLDPAMQQFILTTLGVSTGIFGLLAAVNALSLLFGGVAAGAVGKFFGLLIGGVKIFAGFAGPIATIGTSLAALSKSFTATAGAMALLGAPIRAVGAALIALAVNPVTLTIAAITAALYVGVRAWQSYREGIDEAVQSSKELTEINFQQQRASDFADQFITTDGLDEFDRRVTLLQQYIQKSQALLEGVDLVNFFKGAQNKASGQTSAIDELRDSILGELSKYEEALFEIEKAELQFDEAARAARERIGRFNVVGQLNFNEEFGDTARADFLQSIANSFLSEAEVFEITELRSRLAQIDQNYAQYAELQEEAQQLELSSIQNLVDQLALNNVKISGELAQYQPLLVDALNQDGVSQVVVEALAQADAVSFEGILRTALEAAGESPERIAAIFGTIQLDRFSRLVAGLEQGNAGLQATQDRLRGQVLSSIAGTTDSLTEALDAGNQAALLDFERDIQNISDDVVTDIQDSLNGFSFATVEGYASAIDSAFSGTDYENLVADNPDFADIIGGQFLIDAIRGQIDASTTVEQAEVIVASEFVKYKAIMDNYVDALIEAGIVAPEVAEAVRNTVATSVGVLDNAFLSGLLSAQTEVDKLRNDRRFQPDRKKGGGGVNDALKNARDLENAFRDASREILRARKTIAENTNSTDLVATVSLLVDIDVEEINNRADDAIDRLERRFADLSVDGDTTGLRERYDEAIRFINLARDADIEAAQSFEAMVELRSQAIDNLISKLQDGAVRTGDAYAQMLAGVQVGLLAYQREVLTIVDIAKDATESTVELITDGVADLLFDTENALENFKKTALDISRQVFEGFTKIFLQNSISSLGSSIFGGGSALSGTIGQVLGIPAAATGGQIFGPGTGTSDSILARVSNREFITNARATSENLRLLEAINGNMSRRDIAVIAANEAGLPRFATGTSVNTSMPSSVRTVETVSGRPINITANYFMQGNQSSDGFKRTAAQHAKQLQIELSKAEKLK